MKGHTTIAAAVAAISSAFSAFASGNSHSGSSSAAPAAHHSASAPATTAAAPRFNGGAMPNYARSMPYRPTVVYRNSNRTFNYPPVGVSNAPRLSHSNASNFNNARVVQSNAGKFSHNAGNFQSNAGGVQRSAGNSNRTGGNLQHTGALNLSGKNKLDPQTSARLRNWSGNVSSTNQAHQNHWNNFHHHHDHWWWRNHCAAFIFFDWGWWGWYDGWWYPAWGYDPYSYYEYNEPIYGNGDLSPEQIIAGVQVALQQRGYYTYEIDGRMGPLTRAAIARYQRDNRLPITSGLDATTLGSLGVIR
jgi:hypothetical protein